MTNLEIIRKACIEANPCAVVREGGECDKHVYGLAAVLLAIEETIMDIGTYMLGNSLILFKFDGEDKFYWNLREDDLTKQSEETINFLAELLRENCSTHPNAPLSPEGICNECQGIIND